MFRKTLFAAVAALTLTAGAVAAHAQSAHAQSAQPADVGSFVYNQDGVAIGSLHAVQGNQAVVWLGFFNTPGNHFVTVPASQLASNGGQLILNGSGDSQVAAR